MQLKKTNENQRTMIRCYTTKGGVAKDDSLFVNDGVARREQHVGSSGFQTTRLFSRRPSINQALSMVYDSQLLLLFFFHDNWFGPRVGFFINSLPPTWIS